VVGFQFEHDARRFLTDLGQRLEHAKKGPGEWEALTVWSRALETSMPLLQKP
jgi:hypothetical protein